jgi:signal transduction histidine kinase
VHRVDVTALVSAMRQREEALQLFTHDMRAAQSAILAALDHDEFQSISTTLRDGIERNAQRTLNLADGFVRMAQAETTEYVFEPIDLFHLLGDAVDALWPIARAAGVELDLRDPGREFVVNADRGLMSRALINLLDNAIRFSGPGERVDCSLHEARLHGKQAVDCVIADQASGTSGEQQRSLFQRFARSPITGEDRDGRPVRSGSIGLGLAVAHTVVTRHDGSIDCHTVAGQGTNFTVTLPLCEAAGDEAPSDAV